MRWAYLFTGVAAVAVGVSLYVTSGDGPQTVDPTPVVADENDTPVAQVPQDAAEPEATVAAIGEPEPSAETDPTPVSSEEGFGEPETDSQLDGQPPAAAADTPAVPTDDGEEPVGPTAAQSEPADQPITPHEDSAGRPPTDDTRPGEAASETTPLAGTSDPEISETSVAPVAEPEVDAADAGSEPQADDEAERLAGSEPAAPDELAPPVAVVQLPERTIPDPVPPLTDTEALEPPAGSSAAAAPEPESADAAAETVTEAQQPSVDGGSDRIEPQAEPPASDVDAPSVPIDVPESPATDAVEAASEPVTDMPDPTMADEPVETAHEAETSEAAGEVAAVVLDTAGTIGPEGAGAASPAVSDAPEPAGEGGAGDPEASVAVVHTPTVPADPLQPTMSEAGDAPPIDSDIARETEVTEPAEAATSETDQPVAADVPSAPTGAAETVAADRADTTLQPAPDLPEQTAVSAAGVENPDAEPPASAADVAAVEVQPDDAGDSPAPADARASDPSVVESAPPALERRPQPGVASEPAPPAGEIANAEDGSAPVAVAALPPSPPEPVVPSFDAVRVSGAGNLVVAGTASPDTRVSVMDGGVPIGEAVADGAGQWVFIADGPLDPGSYEIGLVAEPADPSAEEAISDQVLVIVVPESARDIAGDALSGDTDRSGPLAVLVPRDAIGPSVVVQAPQAPVGPVAARDPEPVTRSLEAVTPPATVAEPEAQAPAVTPETDPLEDEAEEVAALPAAPPPPSPEVVVSVVDYDDRGRFFVSGTADAGAALRLYLDNRILLEDRATEDGAFVLAPRDTVAPGLYRLRVDHVDAGGAVIARSEIPFQRNPPVDAPPGHQRITVQPGNSLWVLARGAYGDGLQYSVIFQANRDQIRDPDLIYPGQVFVIPAVPQGVPLGNL